MNATHLYLQTWAEARTRFTDLLTTIKNEDLLLKLPGTRNSAGFLIRHIADVELLFAKNVFGATTLSVYAKTVIAKQDTGEWTNMAELLEYQQHAAESLRAIIEQQSAADLQSTVTTEQFGTKTKAEALGRIISHTAYHAGQLALTLKYGQ